mmetsp:Transcript_120487/g.341409  ORF Transcript_120487/g.341409 Transcript_120487/m.341409 type:complete len:389 (+) Transcript_120487:1043-2209(+)
MYHALLVAVSDGREDVLQSLGDPLLPRVLVPGVRLLDGLHEVATQARLHHDVKVLVVLEVLEDAEDVRMVEPLQHREFLPDLLRRRPVLLGVGLADLLANALPSAGAGELGEVSDQENCTEAALAELAAELVDVLDPLVVLLEELLPPPLVALSAAARAPVAPPPRWQANVHLAGRHHETEQAEDEALEVLQADAVGPQVPGPMLLEHLLYQALRRHVYLELAEQLAKRRPELLVAHVGATLHVRLLERPLHEQPQPILAPDQRVYLLSSSVSYGELSGALLGVPGALLETPAAPRREAALGAAEAADAARLAEAGRRDHGRRRREAILRHHDGAVALRVAVLGDHGDHSSPPVLLERGLKLTERVLQETRGGALPLQRDGADVCLLL